MRNSLASSVISEKVKDILLNLDVVPIDACVANDDPLLEQYLVDSFSFIELIVALEEAFDVEMREEEVRVENFGTISGIAGMLSNKLSDCELSGGS